MDCQILDPPRNLPLSLSFQRSSPLGALSLVDPSPTFDFKLTSDCLSDAQGLRYLALKFLFVIARFNGNFLRVDFTK